jgi:homopolymeric O-antigen transport system permease protein
MTSVSRADPLPAEPLVVVERRTSWPAVDLRGLWAYRELFYFLTWRDIKVRYKQTALGAGWAVLQPLMTMLIFSYFFGTLVKMPSDDMPYPVFAYSGILTWTFFSNSVTLASHSLVNNSGLIAKVYFPRMIIPAAAAAGSLVDFGVAAVLLVPLMAYYGFTPSGALVLLPCLMVLTTVLALAVGMLVSALTVRYRDVGYALPFMMQVWFFVTPIIYPSSLLPASHRWLLALNPLTGMIDGFRAALYGRPLPWTALSLSAVMSVALLFGASYAFKRAEQGLAELL